jgi:hypothetical protein
MNFQGKRGSISQKQISSGIGASMDYAWDILFTMSSGGALEPRKPKLF